MLRRIDQLCVLTSCLGFTLLFDQSGIWLSSQNRVQIWETGMKVTHLGGREAFESANFSRPPSIVELSPTQEMLA
jgi:hypothetical protein